MVALVARQRTCICACVRVGCKTGFINCDANNNDCERACTVAIPDRFNEGLVATRAAHIRSTISAGSATTLSSCTATGDSATTRQ